jgi:glycosyltransferase involved in cell wall biosynthesis
MNICFYTNFGGPDIVSGATQYVSVLGRCLVRRGHQVTVVTRGRKRSSQRISGVLYETLTNESRQTGWGTFCTYPLRSLTYFLRRRRFDVVHSLSGWHVFALAARVAGALGGQVSVHTVCAPVLHRWMLRGFDALIGVSDQVVSQCGVGTFKVPPFVDLAEFEATDPPAARPHPRVGTSGAPGKRRDFRMFLQAAALVRRQIENVEFVWATDPPSRKHNVDAARAWVGLRPHLDRGAPTQVVGRVNVPEFLRTLDVFVYPVQTTERLMDIPPTILECMAAGCPVVTTAVGGIPEVVRNGETGLLVPAEQRADPEAYAKRILQLVRSPETRARIRATARATAQEFDVQVVADRILAIYQQLLQRRQP